MIKLYLNSRRNSSKDFGELHKLWRVRASQSRQSTHAVFIFEQKGLDKCKSKTQPPTILNYKYTA